MENPVVGLHMGAKGSPAVVFRPANDAGTQGVEIYVSQTGYPDVAIRQAEKVFKWLIQLS